LSPTALQALSNLVAIALERVRSQEAANRAEAARQNEELKSTLLDSIAHEFKTPLTSIKAAATALLSTPTPSPEEQRELLTVVDEEADRLGRLVTEAIQMARIEAGKIKLNTSLRSVRGLIGGILQQMKPAIEGRSVTLSVAEDLPPIIADEELMGLAVRHLLDNAVKYSPPGSPIGISAEKAGGCVIISVSDQGLGIPERDQSRIFQKFYRSPDTHQHVTGSGMGLAISLEVVRAHGGEMWVESAPGQGAKFCISVPSAAEEMTP
jgi:two-component system sensor histidine kinase KdpD